MLHLPDEPVADKERWLASVLDGGPIEDVVAGEDGVVSWLWGRWRILESTGVDEAALRAVALAYRRELWLWLVGDRTWAQCCSGLIGRVMRRIPR